MSHPCTLCTSLSCTASTSQPGHSATPGFSVSLKVPTQCHPTVCSSSADEPNLSKCLGTSGRRCCLQGLRQLREAHLSLLLQNHQRHFPIRGEVRMASGVGAKALAHQSEALCHLVQRKDLFFLHCSVFSNASRYSS